MTGILTNMINVIGRMVSSNLDQSDTALIALLRKDSRMSVSALADALTLSRATVKARLDRLIASGAIERFTIETSAGHDASLVRAIMMIQLAGGMSRAVVRAIRAMPQVARLHSTNGAWDLVAELECSSLQDFDKALRAIREVNGVQNSESCLLLDTFSG